MNDNVKENKLIVNLKNAIVTTRAKIIFNFNTDLLKLYLYIGEQIYKNVKENKDKVGYKKRTISSISEELTREFGAGYSRQNLSRMLIFYTMYKKCSAVPSNLSWAQISELLYIKNDKERNFYEIECSKERWSSRELRRQIQTGYYQRVLLGSKDRIITKTNQLATIGNQIIEPKDVLIDPIVINFFKRESNLKEKDIEQGIIAHMKEFLLELGSGFKFIDNQYQFIIDNKKYFVDLVFYNEILKCYVLFELKTTPFKKDVMGQINTYLNYFKTNINKSGDNDPIGIVMCTDYNHIQVEYALGSITNQIFVTKYVTHLPKKEELKKKLLEIQKKTHKSHYGDGATENVKLKML